jgi:ABC-type transport system involved in multi-copper enzyme maturation permease subunit
VTVHELWTGAERLVGLEVVRAARFEWRRAWQPRQLRWPLLLALLPLLVALVGVVLQRSGITVMRSADLLALIVASVYLLLVILLPLIAGTGLVAQEAEARTLVYLLVRPLTRGSLLVGKFLGAWVATSALLLASLLATILLLLSSDAFRSSGEWLGRLPGLSAGLVLGAMAYGALFTLVGLVFSRPAMVGLFWAIGWENAIPFLPGWIKSLTVRHHLAALIPSDALPAGVRAALSPPSLGSGLVWLLGGALVSLAVSVWLFARRDYP